jgi:HEAT repeat protein
VEAAVAFWRLSSRAQASGMVCDPGREAVAVLVDMARDATTRDRLYAINALGTIGPDEPDVVPALVRLLDDPDADVRAWAAAALGTLGPKAAEARAALEGMLDDEDPENRPIAGRALDQIGGSLVRRAALLRQMERRPWLVLGLDDPARALGPEVGRAVPFLRRLLRHDDRDLYSQAAAVLRRIDPEAADRAGVP